MSGAEALQATWAQAKGTELQQTAWAECAADSAGKVMLICLDVAKKSA